MKQRLYLDTSVFGGYFDVEFAEFTVPLFKRIENEEFIVLFSTVTQDELENAPIKVKELVQGLKVKSTDFLEITDEAVDLATEYITGKVVGRIKGYNSINIKNGYKQLEIRSPRDFLKYEED